MRETAWDRVKAAQQEIEERRRARAAEDAEQARWVGMVKLTGGGLLFMAIVIGLCGFGLAAAFVAVVGFGLAFG